MSPYYRNVAGVGMVIGFLVVGLGLLLLYLLSRFTYERFRDREEIARRWSNPRIRRWWIINAGLFFVAGAILFVIRDTDLFFEGDQNAAIRPVVFLAVVFGIRLLQSALGAGQEDRPAELPPPPEPFEGLRKNFTAEGRRELRMERARAGKGRSLWWLYVGLGMLVMIAIVSPQCSYPA